MKKEELLSKEVKHIDIEKFNAVPIIKEFENSGFQARNLANAAKIYENMLNDNECSIILCLAGSLFSAGLKKVVYDLVKFNMVDVIVSTGAIIVDQDFFEALGFKHYIGTNLIDDDMLYRNRIDRIYDTYIDEDQLRICDETVGKIADELKPGAYSSREFIIEMGKFLDNKNIDNDAVHSVVLECYKKGVPIFVPAFSDCSAGFGLIEHQYRHSNDKVSIDSVKDFLELAKIKLSAKETGLVMIGGGVPKNFAQDVTVAADIINSKFKLGKNVKMHKYAIQITVADERDGGLSGSTLKEAHSWGKVDDKHTQMVYSEATIALPLLASYVYHKGAWKKRKARNYNKILEYENF